LGDLGIQGYGIAMISDLGMKEAVIMNARGSKVARVTADSIP
jgi:hypothetical protein